MARRTGFLAGLLTGKGAPEGAGLAGLTQNLGAIVHHRIR